MKDWRQQISDEIAKKGMSQRQFCKRTGVHNSELSYIISKDRSLSVKVALALELYLIRTAEYWMNCQLKEQIKIAKEKDGRF